MLDEFALVLHLEDVYWEQEGRLSVDIVFVLAAVLVLALVVGSPVGIDEQTDQEVTGRVGAMVGIALNLGCVAVAALKGKFASAVIGVVFPLVAVVAVVRLARPRSPWSSAAMRRVRRNRRRRNGAKDRFHRRWRSKVVRLQDAVAGTGEPQV